MEIWKAVPKYEGYYEVSSYGRVKSHHFNRNRILKPRLDYKGYLFVNLSVKDVAERVAVHQLVAIAFLNHVRCGVRAVVDHIDFNRTNNRLENLRIISHRDNSARRSGTHSSQYVGVSLSSNKKSWRALIRIDGKLEGLGFFKTEIEASKAYQERLEKLKKS